MCLGLFLEPTKTLFNLGSTLAWFGMIQFYYGLVFENKALNRGWYFTLGLPVACSGVYLTYVTLRDYLPNWYWILGLVLATIVLQLIISLITSRHYRSVELRKLVHHPADS
jgi:hypothetical protein